jgi:hypothetical protein
MFVAIWVVQGGFGRGGFIVHSDRLGDRTPLLIDGCPVKCLGNRYRDCKGVYEPLCDLCIALGPESEVGFDRRDHNTAPVKWFPRENVTTSSDVVTSFRNIEDYIDTHYIVRSMIAFLPSELQKMRARCLSGNELGEFMIGVILLTSTQQYLRAVEVLTLTVPQFKMSYAKVTEDDINSFMLGVCGKRDRTQTVSLNLWTDPECPEEFSGLDRENPKCPEFSGLDRDYRN